jgi:arylsulfatase A-like enzyme
MPVTPPNILLLYSDQHRAEALGYRTEGVSTPNLDRLAEGGTSFHQCFCPFPVCTPSRMSMLTGQYVHSHGVHTNNAGLNPRVPTFAQALRSRGYSTGCIGKMHFFPAYADVGFDHMELCEQDGPGRFEDDYHRWLANQGALDLVDLVDQRHEFRRHADPGYFETFGAQPSNLPEELHSTTWIGDRAEAYLRTAEPPFCLWCGFVKPHHPFDPPERWVRGIDQDALPLLPGWAEQIPALDAGKGGYFPCESLTPQILRRVMAHYYATIAHMDAQIGRLLAVLEARGLDNTLVIYNADHGELMGYHHLLLKGPYLYDPLVRVPLLCRWLGGPQRQRQGHRLEALVETVDVTATMLDAAGCEPLPRQHGRSLLPLVSGERDEHREAVFSQCGPLTMSMYRTREWKLIESGVGREQMLFNLDQDPFEMTNLYHEPQEQNTRLELSTGLLHHLCANTRPEYHSLDDYHFRRATVRDYTDRVESEYRARGLTRGYSPYARLVREAFEELEDGRPLADV